jgi:hypothetical protein
MPSDKLWCVFGPKGTRLLEAPTWYLARERYRGACPLDCDAVEVIWTDESVRLPMQKIDDHEWLVLDDVK